MAGKPKLTPEERERFRAEFAAGDRLAVMLVIAKWLVRCACGGAAWEPAGAGIEVCIECGSRSPCSIGEGER